MRKFFFLCLMAVFCTSVQSWAQAGTPTLGNYPNKSIDLGSNTTLSPDAAPANTSYATATTGPDFKGKLEVNPGTGVVRITNAHPAGTYTITVAAYEAGGTSATRTFSLTVNNTASCTVFNANAFAPVLNYGVGTNPGAVAVGDFNGDGRQDLATANFNGSGGVSVLLRKSDNTGFETKVNYGAGSSPSALAVGDFNGDGRQDIAAINYWSASISVLLRKSDNTGFETKVDYVAGANSQSITVGDFNGDGRQDLVTATSSSNTISVLLRKSDNTGFETKSDYGVGNNPVSVAVGDFNGDGRQDIATTNRNSNNVSVLLRKSDNTGFEPKVDYGVGTLPQSVAVGDFNGDGGQDLATANYTDNTVSVLERVCCPVLTNTPGPVIITNSTCGVGCIVAGGSISAPGGTPCPAGATLQYQVNGGAWSTTLPTYAQTGPVQTIKTRCTCDIDPVVFSPESSATTVPGICTTPVITAPTLTQPTCTTPTGTIIVNATVTGGGTLEYSVDNGSNWQSSATFSGLAAGNYTLKVRLQSNPACEATYGSNPVTLTSPFTSPTSTDTWTGCVSTNWATPGNWADGTVPTAADDAVIPNTTNKPTIFGGTAAIAKSIEVQSGATLTIAAMASLTVNGSKSISGNTIALFNSGTVTNSGQVAIGSSSMADVGKYGIRNEGTFTNSTGGNIQIDRWTDTGLYNEAGSFTNSGNITIGASAATGKDGIFNRVIFINNSPGLIQIDRSFSAGISNLFSATFTNSANITIGSLASVGTWGILNQATFNNNTGGEIKIDNATSIGLYNASGTFTNVAKITIGATVSAGMAPNGLTNNATFNNNTGGQITIDRVTFRGIQNNNPFSNTGEIRIGATAITAQDCIGNTNSFINYSGGKIYLDRAWGNGIWTSGNSFQNSGEITVGSIANTGVAILNTASFSNNAAGSIQLDRVTRGLTNTSTFTNAGQIRMGNNVPLRSSQGLLNGNGSGTVAAVFNNLAGSLLQIDQTPANQDGILNELLTTFTNAGTVTIGTLGSIGGNGITNVGTFSNNACATLTVFDNLNNSSTFTNAGLFTVKTAQSHTNSALTNNGIIEYPQGNPIPNVTNNDVIVTPIAVCGTTFSPALQIGGMNDFTVGTTWYKDLALTNAAGTYSPNTFTVTNLTAGSTYPLYFAINDPVNMCSRTVGINVTVTTTPTATIAYSGTPFCKTAGPVSVTLTGTTGGVYSSTTGLTIDANTGQITPSTSTAGTYTVTYTIAASGGCAQVTATTSVEITTLPTATISYTGTPFCKTAGPVSVTLTGTTGGVYSSTTGLTIDANTGQITPSTSTAGTYTVTYTIAASGGCAQVTATTSVEITTLPTATIAYSGTPFCKTAGPAGVTLTGTTGGVYSSTTGLTIDANTGQITPSTSTAGTYTVTYTIAASGGCAAVTATTSVTINPLPTATISGTTQVCQNAPFPQITFTGAKATAPYTFTYKINNGSNQTVTTTNGTGVILPQPTTNAGVFEYTLVSVKDGSSTQCSQNQSGSATISVNGKPTLTLTANGETFNEGNSATLCDTDANPVNGLQFTVLSSCIVGSAVWRVQAGSSAWSDWSSTVPGNQPSNNTAYRYQAACDANCSSTFTEPITLTINYRASTPQNVSLVADGTTIAAGESKTICDAAGNTITFNATCAAGEILLYSVDGSDFSNVVPSQIIDGNFHKYRVRCRKADNTPSCVETESGVISLKITTSGPAPTAGITPTNGCGTPTAFSGSSNCGVLTTVWYNAATNQVLPTLPTTTPNATTSYYARCQNEAGCLSEPSNTVTFTITPVNDPPTVTASADIVCTGTPVTVSANCPAGSTAFWNTGVTTNSFQVAFSNVTTQTYWAKCIFPNGCQSPESSRKSVLWKAFELTFINIGQSKSAIKPANDRNLWSAQFITPDAGPVLENSTRANPTIYHSENVNKTAPRFWTIQVETCALGTNGSITYDMLATPEVGVVRSYNTHENNAPYLMYANREGFTELYAQNHPAYGFYQDNGSGGNIYDAGLPKGLYKLGVRYWDQKGQGSIYPSTRQPQGNVLAYQEYWFRIQSQNGVGTGNARAAAATDNGQRITHNGAFAQVMPNPVSNTLHLNVNEAKGQKVIVSLADASGRTLLQRAFVPQTNAHQEEFEASYLSNGMYFLRVNTAQKQTVIKVIKVQ